MNNTTLKTLLTEYEKKRLKSENDLQIRKENLYKEYPQFEEIDEKISSLAISSTKELIKNNNSKILDNLNKQINALKKQKSDLLLKVTKDKDYLLPKYECDKCKDTGYITEGYTTKMCSCLKQKMYDIEYNKSNIYNIRNQTFDNFNLNYYSNIADEKKYNSDISPRENIELIKNICMNFINNFDDENEKNLLFTGNTGLGKTFLSSAIANELKKKGKTVLYQTAPIMLDTIIDYKFGKQNVPNNIYENILNVDLLIIDDLGTEGKNSIKLTELFNILNTRLLNNKSTKTIISTNLSLQNLFNNYDERIVSRIVGNYNICYFFGDDIRFRTKAK